MQSGGTEFQIAQPRRWSRSAAFRSRLIGGSRELSAWSVRRDSKVSKAVQSIALAGKYSNAVESAVRRDWKSTSQEIAIADRNTFKGVVVHIAAMFSEHKPVAVVSRDAHFRARTANRRRSSNVEPLRRHVRIRLVVPLRAVRTRRFDALNVDANNCVIGHVLFEPPEIHPQYCPPPSAGPDRVFRDDLELRVVRGNPGVLDPVHSRQNRL